MDIASPRSDTDYPAENCHLHPNRMWEWDGYCWICVDCIVQGPSYEVSFPEGPQRYPGELY